MPCNRPSSPLMVRFVWLKIVKEDASSWYSGWNHWKTSFQRGWVLRGRISTKQLNISEINKNYLFVSLMFLSLLLWLYEVVKIETSPQPVPDSSVMRWRFPKIWWRIYSLPQAAVVSVLAEGAVLMVSLPTGTEQRKRLAGGLVNRYSEFNQQDILVSCRSIKGGYLTLPH